MGKLKVKTPQQSVPQKAKLVLFGPSGIGKTWFSTSFPQPVYFDVEGGAKQKSYRDRLMAAGAGYLGPEDGTLDPEFLIDQMKALSTEEHPYGTLIIDSLTKLYQTIIANEAEKLGEKDAFGASKKPAVAFMRRLVNWTGRIDMNVVFIAHETTEWGTVNGQRQEVGKQPDVWDKLIYELDLSVQVQKQGNNRFGVVKKSRLAGFPDSDRFPLTIEEFATRFGHDAIYRGRNKLTLATEAQVAEITRLLDILKVPDTDFEKVLTKANADSIADLSEEHATKTIAWLNAKINPTK